MAGSKLLKYREKSRQLCSWEECLTLNAIIEVLKHMFPRSGTAFTMFLDECREMRELLSGVSSNDTGQLKGLAHRLRGSAGFFGFSEVRDTAAAIEKGLSGARMLAAVEGDCCKLRSMLEGLLEQYSES